MHTSPFTVDTTTSHQRDQIHCDLFTATLWTIHMRIDPPTTVEDAAAAVMATGVEYLTGEYVGGDSFKEWCERYETEPNVYDDGFDRAAFSRSMGRALHVDITAPNREVAIQRTVDLMYYVRKRDVKAFDRLISNDHVALSTGGDWAEQTGLPFRGVSEATLAEVAYVSRHPSLADCSNGTCRACQDGE